MKNIKSIYANLNKFVKRCLQINENQ